MRFLPFVAADGGRILHRLCIGAYVIIRLNVDCWTCIDWTCSRRSEACYDSFCPGVSNSRPCWFESNRGSIQNRPVACGNADRGPFFLSVPRLCVGAQGPAVGCPRGRGPRECTPGSTRAPHTPFCG